MNNVFKELNTVGFYFVDNLEAFNLPDITPLNENYFYSKLDIIFGNFISSFGGLRNQLQSELWKYLKK